MAFLDAPPFFQRIKGNSIPTGQACASIAEEISKHSLLACSNGSCSLGAGSLGWVFSMSTGQILSQGAGPVDGHPDLVTSYRSETTSMVALLYIMHQIYAHYSLITGSVNCFCDSNGALCSMYGIHKTGIAPFLRSDFDVVTLAHFLLDTITVRVTSAWVKGHYSPQIMEPKYIINHAADKRAGSFLSSPPTRFNPCRLPLVHPEYHVCLEYDSSIVTSSFPCTTSSALHDKPIITHILCKTGWSPQLFKKLDWLAHGRAFCHLTTLQFISMSKLIHGMA